MKINILVSKILCSAKFKTIAEDELKDEPRLPYHTYKDFSMNMDILVSRWFVVRVQSCVAVVSSQSSELYVVVCSLSSELCCGCL